jgi:hypothetical protein
MPQEQNSFMHRPSGISSEESRTLFKFDASKEERMTHEKSLLAYAVSSWYIRDEIQGLNIR